MQAVNTALANKSDNGHNHDGRYYTEAEMNSLLANKAEKNHTHDDRYYTESEINSLLSKYDTSTAVDNKVAAVNNKVNNAVNLNFVKNNASISLPSSSSTTSIELFTAPAAGFYFIEFNFEFAANTSGARFIHMDCCAGKGVRNSACSNGSTLMRISEAVFLSSGQKVNATALQTSGSTLSCTYWCRYSYIPY